MFSNRLGTGGLTHDRLYLLMTSAPQANLYS